MKKPEELIELLEALATEVRKSSALTEDTSRIAVYIGKGTLTIDSTDTPLILHSPGTVKRFFEALGSPAGTAIEVYDTAVNDDVLETLEELFSTADVL